MTSTTPGPAPPFPLNGLRRGDIEAWATRLERTRPDGRRVPLAVPRHRHTYASVLLSSGVSVPAAAEYLGHSPAKLLRTYAHLMPADHDRARSVVQSAFDRDISRVTDVPQAADD